MFYLGVAPKSKHHKSCHTIMIEKENIDDREQVLAEDDIKEIYKQRCRDVGLNYQTMGH